MTTCPRIRTPTAPCSEVGVREYLRGVLWFGIVLTFVGWALVVPRGMGTGSVSHRNVRMGSMFFQTRGFGVLSEERQFRAAKLLRVFGAMVLLTGLLLLFFST